MNNDNNDSTSQVSEEELSDELSSSTEEQGVKTTATPVEDSSDEESTQIGGEDGEPKGRGAEARIKQLLAENKTKDAQIASLENSRVEKSTPIPRETSNQKPPEVLRAISQLKNMGVSFDSDVDQKVADVQNRLTLNNEHGRLNETYNGSDGRPKYNSDEVEKYMRDNGVYQPEVAYKTMHEAELLDWNLKQSSQKPKSYTAPPTAPGSRGSQTITREKLAEMQDKPNYKEWYNKNRDKILKLMAEDKL